MLTINQSSNNTTARHREAVLIKVAFFERLINHKIGVFSMGIVIIFGLVALLAGFGTISALKNKNFLGVLFGLGSFLVFGWFAVMTFINSGYPAM